jgi:putative membrane protein
VNFFLFQEKNMKKIFLFLTLAVLGLSGCGDKANDRNMGGSNNNSRTTNINNSTISNNSSVSNNTTGAVATPSGDDNEFMTKAAQGGMAEVELGKLAVQKAQNAEVKKFGQKMIEDHTNANTELKSVASKKSVTLPTEVNAKQKATMDKLKGLSGAEFDKAYVEAMVDDHKEDVDLFQDTSSDAKDADVKAFATKTLPTLKMHLDMIKGIQSKMK